MISRKRVLVLASAGMSLAAGVLIIATTGQSQADGTQQRALPAAVEVTPVSRADVADIVSGVGTVAAMRDVKVASETSGRVLRVNVSVGDAVRQGQTLVEVDAELKEAAADQARAQMLAAKTNLEKSKKDFERTRMLADSGSVADVELEGYLLASQSAEAQYEGSGRGVAGCRPSGQRFADQGSRRRTGGIPACGSWRNGHAGDGDRQCCGHRLHQGETECCRGRCRQTPRRPARGVAH